MTENRILQNRIDWLLDTIAGRTKKAPLTVEGVSAKNVDYLSFLTCLEEAPSMDILRVCQSRFSLNGADPVWMATVERAILWNSLRITQRYSTGSKIDPQTLNDLITSVNKPDRPISQLRIDQFTRFDYGAELKFLKALSSSGGDVPKATDLIRQEFSDVVFDR